jgi:hypothetical protein
MDRCIAWHDMKCQWTHAGVGTVPAAGVWSARLLTRFERWPQLMEYIARVSTAHQIPARRPALLPCSLAHKIPKFTDRTPLLLPMACSAGTSLPSPAGNVHELPVKVLVTRLTERPSGRTRAHLTHLDIGTFPTTSTVHDVEIPKRPPGEEYRFLKWIHRTNDSDIALVTLRKT